VGTRCKRTPATAHFVVDNPLTTFVFCSLPLPTSSYIYYSNSQLFYAKTGTGKKILLLFHGFGQDHRAFQSWAEFLKEQYTLYIFDLFFHGQSTWASREALEKGDWKEIITLFLQQENITEFEIAGFSMGGKFAMASLEAFPEKIKKLTLLAPDGIKTSFWYSLATYPIVIRALFKSMILHPNRLYRITKSLRSLGLVDKGLLRFVESQMDTEEKRNRVYFSWVYFRHLKFDLNKIASLLNEQQIPFTLIVGQHDKVIQPKNMDGFIQKIKSKRLEIIEAGHNDLIKKALEYLNK
jgi:pimeloyl-ACP methyl ester carboxylesterase